MTHFFLQTCNWRKYYCNGKKHHWGKMYLLGWAEFAWQALPDSFCADGERILKWERGVSMLFLKAFLNIKMHNSTGWQVSLKYFSAHYCCQLSVQNCMQEQDRGWRHTGLGMSGKHPHEIFLVLSKLHWLGSKFLSVSPEESPPTTHCFKFHFRLKI